jgi:hypothetical protein
MNERKPTIPEVIERFETYYAKPGNGAWGSLHVVLDDGNTEDEIVRLTVESAEKAGDAEGAELARLLLRMSRTQRGKINKVIWGRKRRRCPSTVNNTE